MSGQEKLKNAAAQTTQTIHRCDLCDKDSNSCISLCPATGGNVPEKQMSGIKSMVIDDWWWGGLVELLFQVHSQSLSATAPVSNESCQQLLSLFTFSCTFLILSIPHDAGYLILSKSSEQHNVTIPFKNYFTTPIKVLHSIESIGFIPLKGHKY